MAARTGRGVPQGAAGPAAGAVARGRQGRRRHGAPRVRRRGGGTGRRVRPPARVPRRLPDARPGDRGADQRQPHHPPLEGRPPPPSSGAGPQRRGLRRPDGPDAGLPQRHVRRVRRRACGVDRRRWAQHRRSRPPRRLPAATGPRRSLADAHDHPPDGGPGDRPDVRRQRRAAAQGRHDGARDRRAWRAHPGDPGAVRRRARRVPGPPAAARRAARVRAQLQHPDGHPGARVPVPRQRLGTRQRPLRPSAVGPLRRAGRVRDLRRRRGAARAGVHRRRPRRLQLGDGAHGVVGEHHAADDDPRPDQAGVRLRVGHPPGRGRQRRVARHPRDARRAARATSR